MQKKVNSRVAQHPSWNSTLAKVWVPSPCGGRQPPSLCQDGGPGEARLGRLGRSRWLKASSFPVTPDPHRGATPAPPRPVGGEEGATPEAPSGNPRPRGPGGVSALYQDGGGGFRHAPPTSLEDVRAEAAASESARPVQRERRVAAPRSGQGRGGAAQPPPPPSRSWQALSPVGAHKLPPETPKPHSTTFSRVAKIIVCAAPGRRLAPRVAPAPRWPRAGQGAGRAPPAGTPPTRPQPPLPEARPCVSPGTRRGGA